MKSVVVVVLNGKLNYSIINGILGKKNGGKFGVFVFGMLDS